MDSTLYDIALCAWPALGLFAGRRTQGNQAADRSDDHERRRERESMIRQIRAYGLSSGPVLDALARVRRDRFIPEEARPQGSAYGDHPLSIGYGQTISQPYIVAYMTERMDIAPGDRVLEIGGGSGYQAAILAALGAEVYTVEIVPELAEHARRVLQEEGFDTVHVRCGNGYEGWPEHAPYDAILVACAPDAVPEALLTQLADGGRMIVPIGAYTQRLVIIRKRGGRVQKEEDIGVRFVPMVHHGKDTDKRHE